MGEKIICPKCKKEIITDNTNSVYYDDDENELGEHLWLVYTNCPYCGKKNIFNEIWDDFGYEYEVSE